MISMNSSDDTRILDSKEVGLVNRHDYVYIYTKEHISSHRLSKGSKYPTGQDESEGQIFEHQNIPTIPQLSLSTKTSFLPRRRRVIKKTSGVHKGVYGRE